MKFTRVSVLLTTASFPLVLWGLLHSHQGVGDYGLLGSLSPIYYIGFGVALVGCVVGFMFPHTLRGLVLAQVLVVEAYMWLLPALWFSGLIFPASAHDIFFYPDSASIMITGHINPENQRAGSSHMYASTTKT